MQFSDDSGHDIKAVPWTSMLSPLLDVPLIAGWLPLAISILGVIGGLSLIGSRSRRWWIRDVPMAVLAGAGAAGVAALLVEWLRPFPDALPVRMLVWIAVPVTAAVLAVLRWHRQRGWLRRVAIGVALLLVVTTASVKANAFYGYRPTLAAVLGIPAANQIDLSALPRTEPLVVAPPEQPLSSTWHSPQGMPRTGRISAVTVPGERSGFAARQAWLYLPPAYLGTPRAQLPVLVLIPGQPGGPRDWLLAGRLASIMDAFAAAHDGLAPIVIVPDVTGSPMGNTMCVDSKLGAAETYLTEDVTGWLQTHLQADPTQLAIGGFSFGGTCALQMAVRHPDLYPTFLDISGQAEPTLGDPGQTVQQAFGGDQDAYRQVDPLDELPTAHLPGSAGLMTVGRADTDFRRQAEEILALARGAGMSVQLDEVPGNHSWGIASDALAKGLPWISGRLGLIER
jgi:S-formylglutathione hydrolase FrmB